MLLLVTGSRNSVLTGQHGSRERNISSNKQTFHLMTWGLLLTSEDNRSISNWCGRLATLKLEAQISTNTNARSSFREADGPIRKGWELSPESCSIWWENFISNIDCRTHTQLPRGVWKYVAREGRANNMIVRALLYSEEPGGETGPWLRSDNSPSDSQGHDNELNECWLQFASSLALYHPPQLTETGACGGCEPQASIILILIKIHKERSGKYRLAAIFSNIRILAGRVMHGQWILLQFSSERTEGTTETNLDLKYILLLHNVYSNILMNNELWTMIGSFTSM